MSFDNFVSAPRGGRVGPNANRAIVHLTHCLGVMSEFLGKPTPLASAATGNVHPDSAA